MPSLLLSSERATSALTTSLISAQHSTAQLTSAHSFLVDEHSPCILLTLTSLTLRHVPPSSLRPFFSFLSQQQQHHSQRHHSLPLHSSVTLLHHR